MSKESDLKKGGRKANKTLEKKKDDLKKGGRKANKALEMEKRLRG